MLVQTGETLPRVGIEHNKAPWTLTRWLRRWRWVLAAVTLASGSVLLWLPYLGMPLDVDVGVYATVAYWWAHGDPLYRNITPDRSQAIFLVFRVLEAVGLGSVRGIHLAGALCAALCALLLLAIGYRVWDRATGFGSAALFIALMATPYIQGPTTNAELFMLLPLLGSTLLILATDDYPGDSAAARWRIYCSGVLAALATLLKPPGVAALVLAALWLVQRWRRADLRGRTWLRAELMLAAGFISGYVPALVHGLLTAPDRYLDATIFTRLGHQSVVSSSLAFQASHFGSAVSYLLLHFPVLLVAPVGWWAVRRAHDNRGSALLSLWLVTSFAGASVGGDWWPHYFQQLLPPLALSIAVGLRALATTAAPASLVRRLVWIGARCLAALSVFALATLLVWLMAPPADPAKLTIDHTLPPDATALVASYVRAHTLPNETIYVAYGQGDIYYLAQRRPAARYLHWYELQRFPGAFADQVARLNDPVAAPSYVIAAQPLDALGLDADGTLRAAVARHYVLETTIRGIPIYRNTSAQLRNPGAGR
jgi:hypothetical protein